MEMFSGSFITVQITSFGQYLSTVMALKGLTNSSLANLLDTVPQTIYNWKKGFSSPVVPDLIKLFKVLDRPIDEVYPIVAHERGVKFLEKLKEKVHTVR